MMKMSVDRYFMTVIISVKFAQIQLDHITVVVLLDSLVLHVQMLTNAIVGFTIVTKMPAYAIILLVLLHANVIKDMLVMAKNALISTNVVTWISMTVIMMQNVSILKVDMNANVMLVFDQEWNGRLRRMDVLISMNVLKEVTIVTPMQRVTIKEEHFTVNVTLVSKAVALTVMILTSAPKRPHLQQLPELLPSPIYVITISIAKILSGVITVLVIAIENVIMGNVMIRTNVAIKLILVTETRIVSTEKDSMNKMLVSGQRSKEMKNTKRIVKILMSVIAKKVMKATEGRVMI